MMDYIIDEKGHEVISERHQKDFKKTSPSENGSIESTGTNFTIFKQPNLISNTGAGPEGPDL